MDMSILASLQNINLTFGEKVIFHNASFTISSTDRVGLIGLNGQGKSTLLKILMGETEPDTSNPVFIYDKNKDLRITFIPQDISPIDFPTLKNENFFLAFNPELRADYEALWKVEKELETHYEDESVLHRQDDILQRIHQKHGWTLAQNYESYLKHFNFDFNRTIDHLSGGELKKLSLASGLSSQSNLVLWDEPTNHLDIETIEKFEDDVAGQNKAFIMISHDRYLLSNICNKIIHIQNGIINVFNGNYIQYLEYLEEAELERQKHLDKAQNRHRRELAWMRQGIKARGTRSKKRVEGFHKIKSDIKSLKSHAKRIVNLSMEHSGRKTKKLCQIEAGTFAYNDKKIFEDISLSIFKKDKIALVGHNGQGKTTLVKIIQEELKVNSGKFFLADQLRVSVFSQNRAALNDNQTPFDLIGDGQDFVHLPSGHKKHVNSYLEDFLFNSNQIRRPIKTLSGGEKNRLQLALFMKEAADLWVFDEPTNDLDIETIEVLESMLRDYDNAIIIISHDRAFLDNIVNKSWVINNKRIETFVGGYTKIAPYLHALEMEKEIGPADEITEEEEEEVKEDESNKERMNNKEKLRWKKIEKEISDAETLLDNYTQKLAAFDFNDMTDEKTKEYDELHSLQKKWESTLENLYEEWEDLSHKRL